MKTVQDYKEKFAALYNEMIADYGVKSASVSISWNLEKNAAGYWEKKPSVIIAF